MTSQYIFGQMWVGENIKFYEILSPEELGIIGLTFPPTFSLGSRCFRQILGKSLPK